LPTTGWAATELQALTSVVLRAVRKSESSRGGLPMACVGLARFRIDGQWATGDLREKHGGKCGGDPGTGPRITSLWVDRASKRVFVENLEGDRVPIESYRGVD
jgi:hypothetical protein